jgi:hypothetical protein
MLDTIQWPKQNEKCFIVLNKKCPNLHEGTMCVCVYIYMLKIQK